MINFPFIFPAEVLAFFSDRFQDFTLREDLPEFSAGQKKYLEEKLGQRVDRIAQIHQVHGDRIITVARKDFPWKHPIPDADASITNDVGVALTVRTADCLPVFLFDPIVRAIGLVHAGWRSTQQQIVIKTLALMAKTWGTKARDIRAGFGPAIHKCCYEVSPEFKQHFPTAVEERGGRLFFDLVAENQAQLVSAGVAAENIVDSGICTCCDPQMFSFRREGAKAGRHLSFLMLRA